MTDIRDDALADFAAVFGYPPNGLWSAPGRVQDADGTALEIDLRVMVAVGLRDDDRFRIADTAADELLEGTVSELPFAAARGFDLLIESSLPEEVGGRAAVQEAVLLALADEPQPMLVILADPVDHPVVVDALAGLGTPWPSGDALAVRIAASDHSRARVAIDGAFAEHGLAQPDIFVVGPGFGARREN